MRAVQKFQFQDTGGRVKSGGLHAPRPFAPRRARNREMKTFLARSGGAQKVYDFNGLDRLPSFFQLLTRKSRKNTPRAHARARGEPNMRQLAPLHRKALNQAAHAAAKKAFARISMANRVFGTMLSYLGSGENKVSQSVSGC